MTKNFSHPDFSLQNFEKDFGKDFGFFGFKRQKKLRKKMMSEISLKTFLFVQKMKNFYAPSPLSLFFGLQKLLGLNRKKSVGERL